MTKEALKLALEALEAVAIEGDVACVVKPDGAIYLRPAIAAIKASLAQPEQEPTCPECKAAVLYECVACRSNNYPPAAQPEPEGEPDENPVQSTCSDTLRLQGKAYPRTCKKCGLGPCTGKPLAQPEQEAVGSVVTYYDSLTHGWFGEPPPEGTLLYIAPQQPKERNFCPRCGKRTADLTTIHTCTPPKEKT